MYVHKIFNLTSKNITIFIIQRVVMGVKSKDIGMKSKNISYDRKTFEWNRVQFLYNIIF